LEGSRFALQQTTPLHVPFRLLITGV
jgi:hypothetical protein